MREGVERLLNEVLRPLVEADGGTIEIVEVVDRRVVLSMGDACAGCPGAPYTKSAVVGPLLRRELGDDVVVQFATGTFASTPKSGSAKSDGVKSDATEADATQRDDAEGDHPPSRED